MAILQFKLEGQLIRRHPEFHMEDRVLLERIDFQKGTVRLGSGGREYAMRDMDFPTVNPADPLALTEEEEEVMRGLQQAFLNCEKLQRHVRFLYSKGGLYKIYNGNLLYHGCMPMEEDGSFAGVEICGKAYSGKALYDILEHYARRGITPRIRRSGPWARTLCGISGQGRARPCSARTRWLLLNGIS